MYVRIVVIAQVWSPSRRRGVLIVESNVINDWKTKGSKPRCSLLRDICILKLVKIEQQIVEAMTESFTNLSWKIDKMPMIITKYMYGFNISVRWYNFKSLCSSLVQLLFSDTLFCYYNPCKNGGTCEEHGIGYKCRCTPGFEGQTCEGEDISSIYSFVRVFTFHRNHIYKFVYCE